MNSFYLIYNNLINGNITEYKQQLFKMKKKTLAKYILWAYNENISISNLKLDFIINK